MVTAAAGRSSAFGHCIAACHGDCTVRDRYFAGVAIDSPAAGRVAGAGSLRIPALRKESDVIDQVAVIGITYNRSTCAALNFFPLLLLFPPIAEIWLSEMLDFRLS